MKKTITSDYDLSEFDYDDDPKQKKEDELDSDDLIIETDDDCDSCDYDLSD